MSTSRIAPCPFCGCNAGDVSMAIGAGGGFRVSCGNCFAIGPLRFADTTKPYSDIREHVVEIAIEAWNNREEAPVEGVKGYEELRAKVRELHQIKARRIAITCTEWDIETAHSFCRELDALNDREDELTSEIQELIK